MWWSSVGRCCRWSASWPGNWPGPPRCWPSARTCSGGPRRRWWCRVAEPLPHWYARGELRTRARIYRRLLGAQVLGQASYRTSFAFDLVANAMIPAVELLSILALFHVTRTLGGFTTSEVVVMYGLAATAFSIADLAVGNIEKIRDYVRRGQLDAVLVRPMSVLGQLLALDFAPRRTA